MPIVHPENLIQLSANPLGSGFRYAQASCVKLSWDAFLIRGRLDCHHYAAWSRPSSYLANLIFCSQDPPSESFSSTCTCNKSCNSAEEPGTNQSQDQHDEPQKARGLLICWCLLIHSSVPFRYPTGRHGWSSRVHHTAFSRQLTLLAPVCSTTL